MNNFFLLALIGLIIYHIKNEREYDYSDRDKVTDLLPWAYPLKDGTIINKNGSLMKVFKFIGDDLNSVLEEDLVSIRGQLNEILKRLGEGFVLHIEAKREVAKSYPENTFQEDLLQEMDDHRKEQFLEGRYFESSYYISISYFPPKVKKKKLEEAFLEIERSSLSLETELNFFDETISKLHIALKDIFKEVKLLNEEDVLTYLHSCISNKNHPVKSMGDKVSLDTYISDTDITPGLITKVRDEYLGVVSLLSYPTTSYSGMFDALNDLGFEYRWVNRFIYIDNEEAEKIAARYRKTYFGDRKGYFNRWLESKTNEQISEDSREKLDRTEECDYFIYDIQSDHLKGGYHTFTIILRDKDKSRLETSIHHVESLINKKGYVAVKESFNSLEALLGTMPGDIEHNVRKPILTTMNLIDHAPISSNWNGDKANLHFNAAPLIVCEGGESTEFNLNLHQGDVGHTMILGKTGSGKSVLLNTLAYSFKKYPESQVLIFDKGGSSRVLTAGVNGMFHELGKEDIKFQPLKNIHKDSELEWAFEWFIDIFEMEGLKITSVHKKSLQAALKALSHLEIEERTLTGLRLQVQDKELRDILERYTNSEDGVYGKYFDNSQDTFSAVNTWQVFEMEALFNSKVLVPMLGYLFHRLELDFFNGNPTFLILDECWLMLDNPKFANKMKEWLKTLRKKNVSVIFATQAISDITNSSIKDVLVESCLTKIFLPGGKIEYPELYKELGLNFREIEILEKGVMKRDYYYKCEKGGKLFKLNLSTLELAYVGASSPQDQKTCMEYLNSEGDFNEKWKKYKEIH